MKEIRNRTINSIKKNTNYKRLIINSVNKSYYIMLYIQKNKIKLC